MGREQAYPVSTTWEEHTHISEQRCSCGGEFDSVKWELHFEDKHWLEVAYVKCVSCGAESEFWFDVTSSHNGNDISSAWPPPYDGPYAVKGKEYRKRAEAITTELDAGHLTTEDAETQLKQVLNECNPRIAGKYQVFGHRKGSMGIAYLCVDTDWSPDSPRPYFVICKTLDFLPDDISIEALKREANLWIALGNHTNIVELFDVIAVSDSRLILVMEAVLPGPSGSTTLREWIDNGNMILPLAIRFLASLCQALAHCQSRIPGFVHGDLKPENIFVGIGNILKLSDFGLARASGFTGPHLGNGLGTPLYLAPECWRGGEVTEKSDIYAVGMIMYEMLAAKHPFQNAKDIEQLKLMHLHRDVHPLSYPVIPIQISTLVLQCVEKDPSRRPTFSAILHSLSIQEPDNYDSQVSLSAAEWNNKGLALAGLGRHWDAIQFYIHALCLNPANPTGWGNLAVSLSKLRQNDHAEKVYRHCIGLSDVPAQMYANYATHLLRSGNMYRYNDAIAYCDTCLELQPYNLLALINKSALLNSIGRYQQAAEVAERAKSIDPSHPHIWIELGTAYMKMGRRSKAKKCAKKALQLDPAFDPARRLELLLKEGA